MRRRTPLTAAAAAATLLAALITASQAQVAPEDPGNMFNHFILRLRNQGRNNDNDNVGGGAVTEKEEETTATTTVADDNNAQDDEEEELIGALFGVGGDVDAGGDGGPSPDVGDDVDDDGGAPDIAGFSDAELADFVKQQFSQLAGGGQGGDTSISVGDDSDESDEEDEDVLVPEATREQFASSVNDFTQAFFSQMLLADSDSDVKNLVFSPFSLHVTVAMLASGATGGSDTQRELLDALGRFANIAALEGRYGDLLARYKALGDKFLIGNRVWLGPDYAEEIRPEFASRVERVYRAELVGLEGADTGAWVRQVNGWVANVTKNRIESLFEQLSPELVLLLTNAIYFKDAWTAPFEDLVEEEDLSRPQFHLADGTTVKSGVQLMTRMSYDFRFKHVRFAGLDSREFTLISIPYMHDLGERFEMVLVVPRGRPSDILILENYMQRSLHDPISVDNIFDKIGEELETPLFEDEQIKLIMPAFNVSSDVAVGGILAKMGVEAIFSDGDFGRMASMPLRVSQVKHKAIIQVDKEGTVGAAATGIELTLLSGFTETNEVVVDRPFVFVIRDRIEKVTLFAGKVMDPRL